MVEVTGTRERSAMSDGSASPVLSSAIMESGYGLKADEYDLFYDTRLGLAEDGEVGKSLRRGGLSAAVLDLGCGNGKGARLLSVGLRGAGDRADCFARRGRCLGFKRYVGTDISAAMLTRWRCGVVSALMPADDRGERKIGFIDCGQTVWIDLLRQSMSHAIPAHVFDAFNLTMALWSIGYVSPEAAMLTLTQAARASVPGARLVVVWYTPRFERSKCVLQTLDPILTVADATIVNQVECHTPWRVERMIPMTGPLSRLMGGRLYWLTSRIDRAFFGQDAHNYVLMEARIP